MTDDGEKDNGGDPLLPEVAGEAEFRAAAREAGASPAQAEHALRQAAGVTGAERYRTAWVQLVADLHRNPE